MVVGGNASPGSVIGKDGILCTITCDRAFKDTGSLLLRGAFPNKQPAIKAVYSGGHTIALMAESQVAMAAGDTFSVIVPVTWAL